MTTGTSHLPVKHLRLPAQRHIPGTGTVAELKWLQQVSFQTPSNIVESEWQENLPYRYGWLLFLNQYFWEAHEVWEPVWLQSAVNSQERFLVQGLIQLANARLKQLQRNPRAADRLKKIAYEHFAHAFPPSSKTGDHQTVMGFSPQHLNSLMP